MDVSTIIIKILNGVLDLVVDLIPHKDETISYLINAGVMQVQMILESNIKWLTYKVTVTKEAYQQEKLTDMRSADTPVFRIDNMSMLIGLVLNFIDYYMIHYVKDMAKHDKVYNILHNTADMFKMLFAIETNVILNIVSKMYNTYLDRSRKLQEKPNPVGNSRPVVKQEAARNVVAGEDDI